MFSYIFSPASVPTNTVTEPTSTTNSSTNTEHNTQPSVPTSLIKELADKSKLMFKEIYSKDKLFVAFENVYKIDLLSSVTKNDIDHLKTQIVKFEKLLEKDALDRSKAMTELLKHIDEFNVEHPTDKIDNTQPASVMYNQYIYLKSKFACTNTTNTTNTTTTNNEQTEQSTETTQNDNSDSTVVTTENITSLTCSTC